MCRHRGSALLPRLGFQTPMHSTEIVHGSDQPNGVGECRFFGTQTTRSAVQSRQSLPKRRVDALDVGGIDDLLSRKQRSNRFDCSEQVADPNA